jgi:glycosyltransferase involved in cell wall biosynthesis
MSEISVITICFNNLADLLKTCASVDMQNVKPFEHWIINGSTMGEIENWLLNTPQPSYRRWINERDTGIADAFNKGIANAKGKITHLLNSGDEYGSNDVLYAAEAIFINNSTIQWISGNIQLQRSGKTVVVGKPFDKKKLYRGMRSVSHPTWFVKKEVYSRAGFFKGEYKIAMDYDLMCRIANEPYAYLDKVIVIFDDSGVSSIHYLRSLEENKKVYESYFGYSIMLEIWQWRLKVLHYLLQTSFGKWMFHIKKKIGLENW